VEMLIFVCRGVHFCVRGVDFCVRGVGFCVRGVDLCVRGVDLCVGGVDFCVKPRCAIGRVWYGRNKRHAETKRPVHPF
jgi:hypothetical protein